MQRINREDEKGAMGVGTLIIFIAMVLVAAVAAGVLIDTANQLQQQAQRTGSEAIQEVSSSFRVVDAFGEAENGDEIENIKLKVSLAAGANPQDLDQTIIQVQTEDEEVNLQAGDDDEADAGEEEYGWEDLKAENDGDTFVNSGDLYMLNITLDEGEDDYPDPLGTQERVDINIIPKHGPVTYEQIVTPATITTDVIGL